MAPTIQVSTDPSSGRKFIAKIATPTIAERTLTGAGGSTVAEALADNINDGTSANRLSDFAGLAAAITALGASGRLYIDKDEALAAVDYKVPEGVTLVGAGGVLTAQNGTTLRVFGDVEGRVKMFDHANEKSTNSVSK